MTLDTTFRLILAVIFITVIVTRKIFERRSAAIAKDGLQEDKDSRTLIVIQGLLLALSNLAMIAYLINPSWMAWSSSTLSDWERWLGVVCGIAGTELLIWTHRVLGENFFGGTKIRPGHELITSGPYRRIRHPMYTAFLAIGISWFLLSENWIIAGFWLAGTVLVIATRLQDEEQMMLDEFGNAYRDYVNQTGRFLPKIRSK